MNEIDVDPKFEARLRETLQAVARTTPRTITPHDTRPPSPTLRRNAMGIAAAAVLIAGGAGLVMVQRGTTGSTTSVVTTLAPVSAVEPAPAPSSPTVTVEDPPITSSSMVPLERATGCEPDGGVGGDRTSWSLHSIEATTQVFDGGAVGIVLTDSVSKASSGFGCMGGSTAELSLANGMGLASVEQVADGVIVALAVPHGRTPVIASALTSVGPMTPNPQSGFDTYLFAGDYGVDLSEYGPSAGMLGGLIQSAWQEGTTSTFATSADLLVSETPTEATTATIPPTEPVQLTDMEFTDWIGQWELEPQAPSNVVVGNTGTLDYTIELTESSFCVRISSGGDSCFGNNDPATFWSPQPLFYGSNGNVREDWWTLWYIVPSDVELSLWADGIQPCDLQPFSLAQFGDAVLWACEHEGQLPSRYDVRANRGSTTVVVSYPDPNGPPSQPT